MSTLKKQKNLKKEKKREINSLNVFLSLFGIYVQGYKVINNKAFDLFCTGTETQKADLRYLLINEGYITRTLLPKYGKQYGDHEYSITQKGLDYLYGHSLFKRLKVKKISNKIKFPLLAMMRGLMGKGLETKVQAIFYFFASDTYKQDLNKLTEKFFFDGRVPTQEEMKSKEYRNIKSRFNVIMETTPINSKTQYPVAKTSGPSLLILRIKQNRFNKGEFLKKIIQKSKQIFISNFMSCCSFKIQQKFKYLSVTPFVQNTKNLLKNNFGTFSLRNFFKKHLTLIEKNPTNEQIVCSLQECDNYLCMGATIEHERCLRILRKQSKNISESEAYTVASRNYTNGFSQYLLDDLQKKPNPLKKKIFTLIETIIDLEPEAETVFTDCAPEMTEDEFMMIKMECDYSQGWDSSTYDACGSSTYNAGDVDLDNDKIPW